MGVGWKLVIYTVILYLAIEVAELMVTEEGPRPSSTYSVNSVSSEGANKQRDEASHEAPHDGSDTASITSESPLMEPGAEKSTGTRKSGKSSKVKTFFGFVKGHKTEKRKCPAPVLGSMKGKTVIVTGANRGIGFETARGLVRLGAKVIMGCRNETACTDSRRVLVDEFHPTDNAVENKIICMVVDLSSFPSIRQFVEQFNDKFSELDVLIHNAAMTLALKGQKSHDGHELTMKTNYLGPWLLTQLLIPTLSQAVQLRGEARVVVVSSDRHRIAKFDVQNWDKGLFHQIKPAVLNYYTSKRALILFAMELNRRLISAGITAYSLHPGAADSGIWDAVPFPLTPIVKFIAKRFFNTAAKSAQTSIYLASVAKNQLNGKSGKYFEKCHMVPLNGKEVNEEIAEKLWNETENVHLKSEVGGGLNTPEVVSEKGEDYD